MTSAIPAASVQGLGVHHRERHWSRTCKSSPLVVKEITDDAAAFAGPVFIFVLTSWLVADFWIASPSPAPAHLRCYPKLASSLDLIVLFRSGASTGSWTSHGYRSTSFIVPSTSCGSRLSCLGFAAATTNAAGCCDAVQDYVLRRMSHDCSSGGQLWLSAAGQVTAVRAVLGVQSH